MSSDQGIPEGDGLFAVFMLDNWDGEECTYWLLARRKPDGSWVSDETGKPLLECEGDAVLKAVPLGIAQTIAADAPVGEAAPMPGAEGFTMACFSADQVPVGTRLYTARQPEKQQPLSSGLVVGQAERIAAILSEAFRGDGTHYRDSDSPEAKLFWQTACRIQKELADTGYEGALVGPESERATPTLAERDLRPLPYLPPCNPACDPELNGRRDRNCWCKEAKDALAPPQTS